MCFLNLDFRIQNPYLELVVEQDAMHKHSWWFLVFSFHVFKYIDIFITV